MKKAAEERKKQLISTKDDTGNKNTTSTRTTTGNRGTTGNTGTRTTNYVPDNSQNLTSSKRRQDIIIPFESELIGICLTCCSIF
jgi:hypothetical protein